MSPEIHRPPINRYIREYAEKIGNMALSTESDPEKREVTPANVQYFELPDVEQELEA